MRVHLHNDQDADFFANLLLRVGDGKTTVVTQPDIINIKELGNTADSLEDLINKVYPNFINNVQQPEWLSDRVILAPLNETVAKINEKLTDMMTLAAQIYLSINTAISEYDATHYPTEFLNSKRLLV